MKQNKINTSKQHILELYKSHVAVYYSNRSRHSMRRNAIVEKYEKAMADNGLVVRRLDNDGKPFVMVLQCGPSAVPPHSWTLLEIPWCLESEITK